MSAEDTKKAVEELRKRFFEDCEKTGLDIFYESDVSKLRNDDSYCGLYVTHHQGNVDQALQHAKDNLKWRKEFGVQELKETQLPLDYRKDPNIFKFNYDKEGNPIVLLIVKKHKKDSKRSDDQKRMIVYWVEKMVNESPNHKITVLYDCADSGYSNMDMEMTMFVANLFIKYYPDSLGFLLVYDMPWLFNAIWKVIKPLLPKHARHKVKFVNKDTIKDDIDLKCLPTRMGGEDSSEFCYPSLENSAER